MINNLNQTNPTNNVPIKSRINPSQRHQFSSSTSKQNLLRNKPLNIQTNVEAQHKRNVLRATEPTLIIQRSKVETYLSIKMFNKNRLRGKIDT